MTEWEVIQHKDFRELHAKNWMYMNGDYPVIYVRADEISLEIGDMIVEYPLWMFPDNSIEEIADRVCSCFCERIGEMTKEDYILDPIGYINKTLADIHDMHYRFVVIDNKDMNKVNDMCEFIEWVVKRDE